MTEEREVVIDGDGGQTRDFVYVLDVISAVLAALTPDVVGPVNIGTGTGTSIVGLFRMLAAALDYRRAPVHGPGRTGDIRHSVLASSRAKAELGWEAHVSLEQGLRATVASRRGGADPGSTQGRPSISDGGQQSEGES